MCLTLDERFKTREEARKFTKQPLIAKKDITVYKILYNNGESLYRRFK